MSKIIIFSDIHWGVGSDSPLFLEQSRKYFHDFLFPYARKHGIKTLINAGDTFDKRRQIKYTTLEYAKKHFFEPLNQEFDCHMIIGNHDCPFKNTNYPNSVRLVCNESYPNIRIYEEPQEVQIEGETMLFLPWINPENFTKSDEILKKSNSHVCVGHLSIEGFTMIRGIENKEGMKASLFSKFEYVFSGHFHYRSTKGNIYYVGNPHETTWADYENTKGFYVLDLDTRKLEFIENPNKIYLKFLYDKENIPSLPKTLENKMVMIEEVNSETESKFQGFVDKVKSLNPNALRVETQDKIKATIENNIMTQKVETTETIISNYIENNVNVSNEKTIEKLKTFVLGLYKEANSTK